ncbi:MAG: MFS transporter, partial [Campylobacterota bacterium]|nr:MFS transporter [Campylobacterota bacterium]
MKNYIELLKSNELIRRLSIIQLISYFGAWFSNVAIYTLLINLDVDAMVIATVAALHFLPGALQAPFSGILSDKYNPKKMMLMLIVVEIIATFLLIFITDLEHISYLYILIFIRMGASSFYFTVEMSILPRIVTGDKLRIANEIHSIIWSFSYTFGMAIGGLVVYLVGVKSAFLIDAFMFVIAFNLLYFLNLEIKRENHKTTAYRMFFETFSYFKQEPKIFALILLHAFIGFSAFDALVALSVNAYYSSVIAVSLAIGMINASRAVGLVVGPIVFSKHINAKKIVYLFIFQALTIFIWAYAMENFILSLVASLLTGFSITTLWSYTYTLLQHNCDEKYYGRVV